MPIKSKKEFEKRKACMVQSGCSLREMANLRQHLKRVPEGPINVQALGYMPSSNHPLQPEFVYVVDTDSKIWLLDDSNEVYVMNMFALSHSGGIKPFPATGTVFSDGRLQVTSHATWQ